MRAPIGGRLGLSLALRFDEALKLATDIEGDIAAMRLPNSDLLHACQAIRSVAIALKDDSDTALPLAQDCVNRSSDPWTTNVASNVVRFSHMKAGNLKLFHATPWIPYSVEEDRRNVFASVYRHCLNGLAEERQIRLARQMSTTARACGSPSRTSGQIRLQRPCRQV